MVLRAIEKCRGDGSARHAGGYSLAEGGQDDQIRSTVQQVAIQRADEAGNGAAALPSKYSWEPSTSASACSSVPPAPRKPTRALRPPESGRRRSTVVYRFVTSFVRYSTLASTSRTNWALLSPWSSRALQAAAAPPSG